MFNEVQQILKDNKKYASKKRKYDYLLTGKTYCECGFRRVGDGYSKGVNAVVVDGLFWRKLQEILVNPVTLRQLAEKWLKNKNEHLENLESGLEQIKIKVQATKDEEMRHAKLYGEETIDAEQFEQLIGSVKKKKVNI